MVQEPENFEGYFWRGFLELQRRDNYKAVRSLRRAERWTLTVMCSRCLRFPITSSANSGCSLGP